MSSTQIKDKVTRDAVKKIEDKIRLIEQIPQLPTTSTLQQTIATINKITSSLKRR